jgi:hypothetical protein
MNEKIKIPNHPGYVPDEAHLNLALTVNKEADTLDDLRKKLAANRERQLQIQAQIDRLASPGTIQYAELKGEQDMIAFSTRQVEEAIAGVSANLQVHQDELDALIRQHLN